MLLATGLKLPSLVQSYSLQRAAQLAANLAAYSTQPETAGTSTGASPWSSGDAATSSTSTSNSSSNSSSSSSEPAWSEAEYLQDYAEEQDEQEEVVDRQQVLRQVLRRTHAAEAAMTHVLAGVQLGLRGRPDAAWFAQQEQEALEEVQQLLPKYHVRPSALLSVLQAAGVAAGAAAALVPRATRDAAIAALQESLTDLNNDNLRLLREAGLSSEAPEVRAVLLKLRDLERAAEGAATPPDLMTLQQAISQNSLAAVGVTGVVGAVVKAAADAAIAATTKV